MSAPATDRAFVKTICRMGQGHNCCRYLICDGLGFHCAKLSPALAIQINARVKAGSMTAQADNCAGKPLEDIL